MFSLCSSPGATTLENPYDAHDKIAVAPKPKELTRNISVLSNPPPNLFSLAVRQNESSTLAYLSSKFFSVHYRSEGDGSLKGTIELNVSTSAVTVEERFNHFLLSASNGLVGRNVFLYKLTWIRLDSKFDFCFVLFFCFVLLFFFCFLFFFIFFFWGGVVFVLFCFLFCIFCCCSYFFLFFFVVYL